MGDTLGGNHADPSSETNLDGEQFRKPACNRCRGHKLRCERSALALGNDPCKRCLKARAKCVTSPPVRGGRQTRIRRFSEPRRELLSLDSLPRATSHTEVEQSKKSEVGVSKSMVAGQPHSSQAGRSPSFQHFSLHGPSAPEGFVSAVTPTLVGTQSRDIDNDPDQNEWMSLDQTLVQRPSSRIVLPPERSILDTANAGHHNLPARANTASSDLDSLGYDLSASFGDYDDTRVSGLNLLNIGIPESFTGLETSNKRELNQSDDNIANASDEVDFSIGDSKRLQPLSAFRETQHITKVGNKRSRLPHVSRRVPFEREPGLDKIGWRPQTVAEVPKQQRIKKLSELNSSLMRDLEEIESRKSTDNFYLPKSSSPAPGCFGTIDEFIGHDNAIGKMLHSSERFVEISRYFRFSWKRSSRSSSQCPTEQTDPDSNDFEGSSPSHSKTQLGYTNQSIQHLSTSPMASRRSTRGRSCSTSSEDTDSADRAFSSLLPQGPDVPVTLNVLTCYICLVRIYKIIFAQVYHSLVAYVSLRAKAPSTLPDLQLFGFHLKLLIQAGSHMLDNIDRAVVLLCHCTTSENDRNASLLEVALKEEGMNNGSDQVAGTEPVRKIMRSIKRLVRDNTIL